MPSGNEWLALTPEPTLEPDLPICDPHHHFWVQRPEPVDYQQYLLPDLVADITSGHNVRSTVFIEARSEYRTDGPEEMRSVGEVEFVQSIADESATGRYGEGRAAAAIIGRADLKIGRRRAARCWRRCRPPAPTASAASATRWAGTRTRRSKTERLRAALQRDDYMAGARVLQDMGLILETTVFFPQLPDLADFARRIPDLTIVLNHIGGMMRTGPYSNRDDEVIPAVAQRHRGGGGVPQRDHETGRHRHAPHRLRLARAGDAHRVRGTGRFRGRLDAALPGLVRAGPLYVREQLPGGQGIVLVQRDVQRLQADVGGIFGVRAGGGVPRYGGARVPDWRVATSTVGGESASGGFAPLYIGENHQAIRRGRPFRPRVLQTES